MLKGKNSFGMKEKNIQIVKIIKNVSKEINHAFEKAILQSDVLCF